MQLHITSLPGRPPGRRAYRFVDWLAAAGQSWWQVLPLGPPDRYRSPYKSQLGVRRLAGPAGRAAGAGLARPRSSEFRERQAFWIGDWERFCRSAARSPTRSASTASGARCAATPPSAGCGSWATSPSTSRPGSADHASTLSCSRRGRWPGRRPTPTRPRRPAVGQPAVSTGRRCSAADYRWWVERVRRTLELFDLARIDHFRGFVAYWAVPAGARTRDRRARGGGAGRGAVPRSRAAGSAGPGCRWWPRTSA